MDNFELPSIILLGFLILWSLVYWIFPLMVVRRRSQREQGEPHQANFLAETGTVHRLGRDSDSR